MNVTNRQVEISDSCSKDFKESIQKYWEINNDEFRNKPRNIAKSLEVPTHEVSNLVRKYSKFIFEICCDRCEENIQHTVFSQSAYNLIVKKSVYTCQTCIELIAEKERIETEKIRQQQIEKYKTAIRNKNWEQLNRYQFKILYNIVNENDFNSFLRRYKNNKSNHFWSAIFTLRDLDLITLEHNPFGSSITNIKYLQELEDALPSELVEQSNNEDVTFNKETNELKFKLTKNPNPFSYDSPEYSGTLEFQQTVILKPGIEYSFGAWKRRNDVLYLTIIPTVDKPLLPKQKNKAW